MNELQKILDNIKQKEKERMEKYSYYGWFADTKLQLTEERAADALTAIGILIKYILEKEKEII